MSEWYDIQLEKISNIRKNERTNSNIYKRSQKIKEEYNLETDIQYICKAIKYVKYKNIKYNNDEELSILVKKEYDDDFLILLEKEELGLKFDKIEDEESNKTILKVYQSIFGDGLNLENINSFVYKEGYDTKLIDNLCYIVDKLELIVSDIVGIEQAYIERFNERKRLYDIDKNELKKLITNSYKEWIDPYKNTKTLIDRFVNYKNNMNIHLWSDTDRRIVEERIDKTIELIVNSKGKYLLKDIYELILSTYEDFNEESKNIIVDKIKNTNSNEEIRLEF